MEYEKRCYLEQFRVSKAPSSAFYIPNFITEDEEKELLSLVYKTPKPKWTQLSNRRLQNWGGLPHPKGMVAEKIPNWLDVYLSKLSSLDVFDGKRANHVLINEYLPSQGIMPHLDGPLFYPTIATISLASHTVLDFYKQAQSEDDQNFDERYTGSLLLEPRSLVCFKGDMYHMYLHGIATNKVDIFCAKNILNDDRVTMTTDGPMERGTRVSLTIRHFPKVLKCKFNLTR